MKPSEAEIISSSVGFTVFYEQFSQLPADEKTKLLVQEISLLKANPHRHQQFAREYSVANLFEKIRRGSNAGCIATCCKYFMKLVIDYAPWEKFPDALEKSIIVGPLLMRENSRHKVFSDYDWLSKEEAQRRINLIIISILTFDRYSPMSNNKVLLWDLCNRLDGFMLPIFDLLKNHFEAPENASDPRFVYVRLLEEFIAPMHEKIIENKPEPNCYWTQWVHCIYDSNFLGTVFHSCFSWEQIVLTLSRFKNRPETYLGVHEILVEMLHSCNHEERNDQLKTVKVNVILQRFLKKLGEPERKAIRHALSKAPIQPNQKELFGHVYDILMWYEKQLKEEGGFIQALFSIPFSFFKSKQDMPVKKMERPDLSEFSTLTQITAFVKNQCNQQTNSITLTAGR